MFHTPKGPLSELSSYWPEMSSDHPQVMGAFLISLTKGSLSEVIQCATKPTPGVIVYIPCLPGEILKGSKSPQTVLTLA